MVNIENNVPLAHYTTFHIGGPADYFVIVHSLHELKDAVAYAKAHGLSYFLLGTGANILVGDKGFRGLVIKNESKEYIFSDTTLTADSGATIEDLMQFSLERNLSGLEDYAGIVSTVGGALWQNLHFLNSDRSGTSYIADIVEGALILHEDNTEEKVDKTYFQFGYDKSILHTTKDIVMSATFRLHPKSKDEIQKTIDANVAWRAEKHPKDAHTCSAGSIFKKIENFGAGRLIEKVGLKGKQIGGATVSRVHANFILNTGTATAKDVRDLIALIQKTVEDQLRLHLEPEI